MSDRLAVSSAFSIFLMASYVLLGGDASQVDLRAEKMHSPACSVSDAMPRVNLPVTR
jgi:hypothetical protein